MADHPKQSDPKGVNPTGRGPAQPKDIKVPDKPKDTKPPRGVSARSDTQADTKGDSYT